MWKTRLPNVAQLSVRYDFVDYIYWQKIRKTPVILFGVEMINRECRSQ